MKVCFKCLGDPQPLENFYKHPDTADGRLNKCKTCAKSDSTNHRNENLKKVRAYDIRRAKTKERIAKTAENTKRWRKNNPEKYKAETMIGNYIRDGKIKRMPCERCGSIKTHAHHDDYSKPLDVKWLCPAHHKERHRELGIS